MEDAVKTLIAQHPVLMF
ncbi:hypothetical protein KIPB_014289, partial [Kipferlia bialata]|eukprot:g14289.t1